MTHHFDSRDFDHLCRQVAQTFLEEGQRVPTRYWQGLEVDHRPEMTPYELTDVTVVTTLSGYDKHQLQARIQPNLPWAEDHFQERVEGVPVNPPPSHVNWPHAQADNEAFTEGTKFSHTYPERFWPKFANEGTRAPNGRQIFVPHMGVRFEYGDLMDVVKLMHRDPYTRQAYLPVFFPEDTGAHHGERIPCTLGYLFRYRNSTMDIVYYIRSCDFRRHFRDDVYMAGRLCQWMSAMLRDTDLGLKVNPGRLIMHIGSFHIFEGDIPMMKYEADKDRDYALRNVW